MLHFMPDLFPLGGTPRKLIGVGPALRNLGVRQAFYLFGSSPDAAVVRDVAAADGVVIEGRRRHPLDARLMSDLATAVRKLRPDVLVTHFARADVCGALVGAFARVPVIKAVEGIFWSDRAVLTAADRSLAALRKAVLANSHASLAALRERGTRAPAVVIYPGVADPGVRDKAVSREVRTELGISDDAFVVGIVGGLIPLRRHSVLLEAVRLADGQMTDGRLVVIVVGDGPLRTSLERQARAGGLAERVKILGYRTDAGRIRHAMDAYVNPAEIEGFGIATVEAMLMGIPVVGVTAGASPELIEDGATGVLVPPQNAAALAEVLAGLAEASRDAAELGTAARQAARGRFSMERYARELDALYRWAGGVGSPDHCRWV